MFRCQRRKIALTKSFPHERGDVPAVTGAAGENFRVFPTSVGMFRTDRPAYQQPFRFPHERGDVPRLAARGKLTPTFSPRAWGCSVARPVRMPQRHVFPTSVGMFRWRLARFNICCRSPHTRGDVPNAPTMAAPAVKFSPHAWGCSVLDVANVTRRIVLPTRVGMFRQTLARQDQGQSSPHTRGDVPRLATHRKKSTTFSPHAWGCSAERRAARPPRPVLPTRVGMFRFSTAGTLSRWGFPHERGDVPLFRLNARSLGAFSPRAWGCSDGLQDGRGPRVVFPRAWGCSGRPGGRGQPLRVFPTSVGMFRTASGSWRRRSRFPHERGDVPAARCRAVSCFWFSPRAWGCSVVGTVAVASAAVFPTSVGMFLISKPHAVKLYRFPHERGDVPEIYAQD